MSSLKNKTKLKKNNKEDDFRTIGKNIFSLLLKKTYKATELTCKIEEYEKKLYNRYKTPQEYKLALYNIAGNTDINLINFDKLEWDSNFFEDIKNKLNEQDEFIKNPFEVVDGVCKCGKCDSEKAFTYQLQTRGCDEPMTTFAKCVKCGNKWTYSG